jgi:hypothetical protein
MHKNKIRILSFLLLLTLFASTFHAHLLVSAATTINHKKINDYCGLKQVRFDNSLYEKNKEKKVYKHSLKQSASKENSDWTKFSSRYYRNNMNVSERKLYDALDQLCFNFLTSTSNAVDNQIGIASVQDCDLQNDQIADVVLLFSDENPQYYFLKPQFSYQKMQDKQVDVILFSMDQFCDGTEREASTEKFRDEVNNYISQIGNKHGYELEKEIHDLLLKKVEYDPIVGNNAAGSYERSSDEQTSAAVFLKLHTNANGDPFAVCASYSEAFTLLCNAMGIPAITVTSDRHEWVEVKINNRWYVVDPTWDDPFNGQNDPNNIIYKWFNISDNELKKIDVQNMHEIQSFYAEFNRPVCVEAEGESGKTEKTPISATKIDAIEDQIFSRRDLCPNVKISYKGTPLVENYDYTLAYSNNYYAGTGTVQISGLGVYYGTITKEFKINRRSISDSVITYNLDQKSYIYSGEPCLPVVTVRYSNDELVKGRDYSKIYQNNIDAGNASVIIKGEGNYTGEETINFKIAQKDISSTVIQEIGDQAYTGKQIMPAVDVRDSSENKTLKEGIDYSVAYGSNTENEGTVSVMGINNYTGCVQKKFKITKNVNSSTKYIPVYRLWNKKSGEHLYTADSNERDTLVALQWGINEGVKWNSLLNADTVTDATPVYRVFNQKSGEHLFTKDQNEANTLITKFSDLGWKNEGICWYNYGNLPVYRIWNKNSGEHLFTSDLNEKEVLCNRGWIFEGEAFMGSKVNN